jgi:hypothetical protein
MKKVKLEATILVEDGQNLEGNSIFKQLQRIIIDTYDNSQGIVNFKLDFIKSTNQEGKK